MTRIGYYEDSAQRSEITPAWVQEKLNAAKWLLKGNIDKSNFIEGNLQKNVVKDFPSDVVAFDNSMKFFTTTETDKNPYKDIFLELVNLCKASPDVAVVGGALDSEMSATFAVEQNKANDDAKDGDSCATSETYNLKKELEIPPNYVPMEWGELADLMIANGFVPREIKIDSRKETLYLDKPAAEPENMKEYILQTFNKTASDYVETMNYWRDGSSTNVNVNMVYGSSDKGWIWGQDVQEPVIQAQCPFPKCEFIQKRNMLSYETAVKFEVNLGRVEPDDSANDLKYLKSQGFSTVKLIPEILCKVV